MAPFTLERFGSLFLPQLNATTPRSWSVPVATLPLALGGAVNVLGASGQARAQGVTVRYSASDVEDSDTDLDSTLDALCAALGSQDRLYARLADGSLRWVDAVLSEVPANLGVGHVWHADLSFSWVILSPVWYGHHSSAGWDLDSGVQLDTGRRFDEAAKWGLTSAYPVANAFTWSNAGKSEIWNPILIVTNAAGAPNLTQILIQNTTRQPGSLSALKYTGTLAANGVLTIDCGAWSVKNDTVDDYDHFTRDSGHNTDAWLPLYPGDNDIKIYRTGGNASATVEVRFDAGWL